MKIAAMTCTAASYEHNERMNKLRLTLSAALLGLLTACGTTPRQSAPVTDRMPANRSAEPARAQAPAGPGYYTVKKGDTLYRIALDQGQAYRDIVAWNSLSNPNDIKVDQVLRVAPPDASAGGAQTGSIASSGVEVRPLSNAAAASGSAGNKTAPRGDKRPYSESALAELQKPEAAAAIAAAKVPAGSAVAAPAKTEPARTAEADDDGIGWIWPTEGRIIAHFEEGKNKGIDITGKMGQHVMAAGAGKVMYAGSGIRGYGNLVIVKHTNNLLSAYAHNKTIKVKEDQSVKKGQVIAEMGNTDADAVKLHFEIRQQGKPVDPSKFLPGR